MSQPDLSYQVYSEFKTSDWYIYWDKEYSKVKKYQLMVVWYVGEDNPVHYDYITLRALLAAKKAETGLSYLHKLTPDNIRVFLDVCEEFCMDIEREFGTKD